ncbi:MAG TPA: ABC transporter substrate-binding protein [Chloroflexota bacterium]|nr:ABC transporter substrate-binding protein [Chloroflexota bacterium]
MSALKLGFREVLLRVGAFALILGPVLATPAQAAPADQQVARKDILIIPGNVNIPAPDIWNPYIPGTFILQGMNQNLMEPLFMLNYETGNIDGWLASGYTGNADQTEWTVTLKPGTEWSDGSPLTSDDVVFTINMLITHAPLLNFSIPIKKEVQTVTAVDDRTIKFTLNAPDPFFVVSNLAGTTSQAIVPVPKKVWQNVDPVTFKNSWNNGSGAIFSGPYVVKSFSSTEFDYKRNDNWWGAKTGAYKLPAPLEIHRPWIGDDATAQQMLASNDSDIGGATTPSVQAALLAQNPKILPYSGNQGWVDPCPRMLTLNTTIAPWDNKIMRHAVSYAMDRQAIVNVVYEGAGGASAISNFIFPTYKALQPYRDAASDILAPLAEFNLDKSHQLIESQGYTMGGDGHYVGPDGTTLSLDVVGPPFMEPWGRMVVQQLQAAGVDANLRLIEWGIFRDQTGRGNFTGAVDWDGCGSVVEPWFGMNRYNKTYVNPIGTPGTENVDNTNNAGRWSNDQYSALMDQMGSLPLGDPRVMDLYKQAVTIWADEEPDIPLVQTPSLLLFNSTYWTNWPTADNNYIQPPSWWEHFLRVLVELKPAQ